MQYNIPEFWINYLQNFYNRTKHITENIQLNTNPSKVCVIIEPRKHPMLKLVIYNFLYFLAPTGWGLHIYHGTENKEYVQEITKKINNINLTMLPYENLSIKMHDYILCDPEFYKNIYNKPEYILIFQTDCLLLKNIDQFINENKYDYIGAPWNNNLFYYNGGNGGLSLRNNNTMIKLCTENKYNGRYHEDIFISHQCNDQINVPDFETKKLFSMETIMSENCFGMHAAYKHQNHEDLKKILIKRWKELFDDDLIL